MGAKVTVEEQISAVLSGEQFNYVNYSEAAFETLLLAQAALAERDAQIAEMRKELTARAETEQSLTQMVDQCVTEADGLRSEIAEMRIVMGPRCPRCNHWLKAEHGRSFNPPRREIRFYCNQRGMPSGVDVSDRCPCEIFMSDLIANHPAIAKEMGLTEAADGMD